MAKKNRHYQHTSRMARESIEAYLGKMTRAVYVVIQKQPSTTEEIEFALGGRHQSVSARVSELWHKHGLVRPSGERRRTTSGRLADVYEGRSEGRADLVAIDRPSARAGQGTVPRRGVSGSLGLVGGRIRGKAVSNRRTPLPKVGEPQQKPGSNRVSVISVARSQKAHTLPNLGKPGQTYP